MASPNFPLRGVLLKIIKLSIKDFDVIENSSVKMTPAFLIRGKVVCLYLSQSFMDADAQNYCTFS